MFSKNNRLSSSVHSGGCPLLYRRQLLVDQAMSKWTSCSSYLFTDLLTEQWLFWKQKGPPVYMKALNTCVNRRYLKQWMWVQWQQVRKQVTWTIGPLTHPLIYQKLASIVHSVAYSVMLTGHFLHWQGTLITSKHFLQYGDLYPLTSGFGPSSHRWFTDHGWLISILPTTSTKFGLLVHCWWANGNLSAWTDCRMWQTWQQM